MAGCVSPHRFETHDSRFGGRVGGDDFLVVFFVVIEIFFSDLTRLNQMIMYSIFVQFNNLSHLFGARFFGELIQEGHRKQELEDIFLYGVSSGFFVWAQLFTLSTRRGTP